MKLYIIYFFCVAFTYGINTSNLPKCKSKDPNLEKCILKGIESMKPRLKAGIPELSLPVLDPFRLARTDFEESVDFTTKIKGTIKNLEVRGGSDFTVEQLKLYKDNQSAELVFKFHHFDVSAEYDVTAKKFGIQFSSSHGKFRGTFSNVVVAVDMVTPLHKIRDVVYLGVEFVATRVHILGKTTLQVNPTEKSSLIGDKLKKATLNPDRTLQKYTHTINEKVGNAIKKYLNKILSLVPLKDVLLV